MFLITKVLHSECQIGIAYYTTTYIDVEISCNYLTTLKGLNEKNRDFKWMYLPTGTRIIEGRYGQNTLSVVPM